MREGRRERRREVGKEGGRKKESERERKKEKKEGDLTVTILAESCDRDGKGQLKHREVVCPGKTFYS